MVRFCQLMHSILGFFDDIELRFYPFGLKISRHIPWDSSYVRSKAFFGLLRRAN